VTADRLALIERALAAAADRLGLVDPEGEVEHESSEGHAEDWRELDSALAAVAELRAERERNASPLRAELDPEVAELIAGFALLMREHYRTGERIGPESYAECDTLALVLGLEQVAASGEPLAESLGIGADELGDGGHALGLVLEAGYGGWRDNHPRDDEGECEGCDY
jgi:hypothetical protein